MQRLARLSLLSAALFLCACSTTKQGVESDPSVGRWVRPSPILSQQLEDAASQLPWAKGLQRLELIRYFATVGEPAYTTLLELALDDRISVSASAYAAMGATSDARLVDAINSLPWSGDSAQPDLALERARTLARLGDWSKLPTLIHGLGDERLYTRALCVQALREITREPIEFDPRAELAERQRGIDAWERWWLKYSGQPMPPRPVPPSAPVPAAKLVD